MCSGTDPGCAPVQDEQEPYHYPPARAPTAEEIEDIKRAKRREDPDEEVTDGDEIECWVDSAFIAVFPEYQTGSPGYCGKLAVVVFDGAPEFVEVYVWPKIGSVYECRLHDVMGYEARRD